MPIRERKCTNCEYEFDSLEKQNENKDIKCPQCGCETMLLFPSRGSFILKCKGFYSTDNK